jgi:hypothetical protein
LIPCSPKHGIGVWELLQLLLEKEIMSPERKKLLKAMREFGGYIANNQQFLLDYGDRYR